MSGPLFFSISSRCEEYHLDLFLDGGLGLPATTHLTLL